MRTSLFTCEIKLRLDLALRATCVSREPCCESPPGSESQGQRESTESRCPITAQVALAGFARNISALCWETALYSWRGPWPSLLNAFYALSLSKRIVTSISLALLRPYKHFTSPCSYHKPQSFLPKRTKTVRRKSQIWSSFLSSLHRSSLFSYTQQCIIPRCLLSISFSNAFFPPPWNNYMKTERMWTDNNNLRIHFFDHLFAIHRLTCLQLGPLPPIRESLQPRSTISCDCNSIQHQ